MALQRSEPSALGEFRLVERRQRGRGDPPKPFAKEEQEEQAKERKDGRRVVWGFIIKGIFAINFLRELLLAHKISLFPHKLSLHTFL